MKLALKIFMIVAVLLVAALVVFLVTDWEAPRLGQKLIAIASDGAGIDLHADRVLLNLRKGLLLEGVVASSEADGESVLVTADLLRVNCSLIALVRGDIVVQRILLDAPRIEVVSREAKLGSRAVTEESSPLEEPAKAGTDEPLDLENRPRPVRIAELSIADAYFISRADGAVATETVIEDLDFQLLDFEIDDSAPTALLGTTGKGRLNARGVRLDNRAVTDLTARLEADHGRYVLSELEAVAGRSGEIEIERIEIDMGQDPYRYRVAASVKELDLNALLSTVDASRLGSASLALDATGEGPGLSGVVAEMVIELSAGRLPSVELLATLDRFLGTTLDGAPYESTEIRLSLVDGLLEVEPFELVTGIAKLGVGGTVELDGEIDLKVAVGLPRDAFQRPDVSEEVLDSLTSRDWLRIPLAVTGTVDDPRFGPDMDAVRELTRQVADSAKDAARNGIRNEINGILSRRFTPASD